MRILLVSSGGGHLAQLLPLRPWWGKQERRWVSVRQSEVENTLSGESVVWAHFPTTRSVPNALRNLFLSWPTLRNFRPDILVSAGAGVSVPFFIMGRILGIRTVYIECFDRITLPTLSGRICYPLSDVFCIQWEEQREFYPDAVNIGPLL
ncbi:MULTISPECIES: PssD/Cps14F family polysaccharide biosynthesis glycosyltransferase [Arthrobacter]|uniref:PssD/Cps14F family polysaccharide biosynthesis glycosyltransferase n=1 Tax=Arthrobacter TaxID=1663 RepID=UPI00210489BC|nr:MULTISPECIES: PssD/Cps14F family polysaccharide biosynthesis glycosyltransferase [Arthrobacter]MCQ1954374.1 UDP-N-acetylglucosamine transferase subunit ALG14 [Arthrobacter sp. zg-Y238]MCQ1957250.1 UDP-N-acetylglucosamine transferase subunit ALG14 [Arthrobacter jinronghuae]